jgi:hypothetical protein
VHAAMHRLELFARINPVLLSTTQAVELPSVQLNRSNCVPSAVGRNLQSQPARGANTREEHHWPHACLLHASRRGNQWHPRVSIYVEKTRTVPAAWLACMTEMHRPVAAWTNSLPPPPPEANWLKASALSPAGLC